MLPAKTLLVLTVLGQLMDKYKKHYLWISQAKMLKLLDNYHEYGIHRRMLNYRLAELEERGFITRRQRHTRGERGELIAQTSLIFITRQGFLYLARAARAAAKALSKSLLKIMFPKQRRHKEEWQPPDSAETAKHQLGKLLRSLENPKEMLKAPAT